MVWRDSGHVLTYQPTRWSGLVGEYILNWKGERYDSLWRENERDLLSISKYSRSSARRAFVSSSSACNALFFSHLCEQCFKCRLIILWQAHHRLLLCLINRVASSRFDSRCNVLFDHGFFSFKYKPLMRRWKHHASSGFFVSLSWSQLHAHWAISSRWRCRVLRQSSVHRKRRISVST